MNSYQKKVFINISAILAIMIVIFAFVIWPAISEIVNINKSIAEERAKLEQKLQLGLNLKQTRKDLEEVKQSIGLLDNVFVKSGHELEFIAEVENLAANLGVNININPDFTNTDAGGTGGKLPVQMSVNGDFKQIVKFLRELEALSLYYNIDLINVYTRQVKSGPETIFQINGQVYLTENKQ